MERALRTVMESEMPESMKEKAVENKDGPILQLDLVGAF